MALAEFLAKDGWPITDQDVEKLRRRKGLGKPMSMNLPQCRRPRPTAGFGLGWTPPLAEVSF